MDSAGKFMPVSLLPASKNTSFTVAWQTYALRQMPSSLTLLYKYDRFKIVSGVSSVE